MTLSVTLSLCAQTPPPPATGPTMEQTADFINQAFAKEGHIVISSSWVVLGSTVTGRNDYFAQKVVLQQPCTLSFQYSNNYLSGSGGTGVSTTAQGLLLDLADPLTLSVEDDKKWSPDSWPILLAATPKQPVPFFNGTLGGDDWLTQPRIMGYFLDQDTATRVAKAYIHAMVLCRKPTQPSLF